jgi:hypothetical protein
MSVGELRRLLRESGVLREVGGEPTPGELADVLWLAMLNRGPAGPQGPDPEPEPTPPVSAATRGAVPPVLPYRPPRPPAPEPRPQTEEVRLEVAEPATVPGTWRVPVQVPAQPQLPDPLPLGRALRPLRRRVASAGRPTLDEEATADLGAEQRLWLPVLTPAREPALDLALVIDASDSMALWHALIREFRLLCERLGAFRDIRTWYLTTDRDPAGQPAPTLRGASPLAGARDPRELLDPSGRRLIVVVTDGVHPWWRPSGPLQAIVGEWAAANPVAIIQPFPQRLWKRSMLRPAVAEFRPDGPGRRTARVIRWPYDADSDAPALTVPILELTPTALHRWALLTAGSGPPVTLAAAVLSPPPASPPRDEQRDEQRDERPADPGPVDPARLVSDFRAAVSASAYRLAGYLSSAAPLTLPVMRLVQQSMMPETGAAELAEVFLSGLLRRLSDGHGDQASYVFAAGVREILFSTITRAEAFGVQGQVGSYLASGQHGGQSFPAVAQTVTDEDVNAAAERYPSSFGRIRRMLLERIGGPLAETAPQVRTASLPERTGWLVDGTLLPDGKIYQPVLFVGLGGAGGDIGVELERRLRDAICGADGNDFRRLRGREGMLPYQLPSCLQFVYADLDQADLDRLPRRAVPGPEHVPAAGLTAHYTRDLTPVMNSYPELARYLRLVMDREVSGWLPPEHGEPRVSPLSRGSGQLPTVARAALFGALRYDLDPLTRDIREAIGKLAASGEDLHALGGGPLRTVDVFVAFSVAGGTGAGIFYDYLHLIARELENSGLRVSIRPLVLMPSAFPNGRGGGRRAELNAASALVDLFRLVDQQNAADATVDLRSALDQAPYDPEEAGVGYPGRLRIVMRPGTIQTGFVFPLPAGADREDLNRSVVSLVMSMAGTGVDGSGSYGGPDRSFADSFVNQAPDRQVLADNGLGRRGVSAALAASLTIPVDELADIVAGRFLRAAVEQPSVPAPGAEPAVAEMEHFLVAAGVGPLLRRPASDFAEPVPARGARNVAAALNDRQHSMLIGLASLRTQLDRDMPRLALGFDPFGAASELLGTTDIFGAQRVIFGDPRLHESGAAGLLRRRRASPAVPPGFGAVPPPVPEFRDRFLGQLRWADPEPVAFRATQDSWYQWASHVAWAQAWDAQTPAWQPVLDRVATEIGALTAALTEFAAQDHEDFARRSAELSGGHPGVSYLLPSGAGRMDQFYQQVAERVLRSRGEPGSPVIGAEAWREAYRLSVRQGPGQAVSYLRDLLKAEIKALLREPEPGRPLLLPRLADLLAEAAVPGARPGLTQDQLDEFRGKLAGLRPANFSPPGSGPLKVTISYPAETADAVIEAYLRDSINLPGRPGGDLDFQSVARESISVVLFRTSMGITEVPEVSAALRLLASAQAQPEPADLLRWRQRTGYEPGYLVTTEAQRVEILHRLLCALWNGRGSVQQGPDASPERLSIRLGGGVTMALSLTPWGATSSWGTLLSAYERWALEDSEIRRRFSAELLRELPRGLAGRPEPPDGLYTTVRDLARGQIALLDDMLETQRAEGRSRVMQLRGFWANTLPAALDKYFAGIGSPVAPNLRELERSTTPENGG